MVLQSVCPRPADLKRNRICLHSENLSFITYTIKFMISLTTYFDTFRTILSSYFHFPFSFSIERSKYGLYNREVHVLCRVDICFVVNMLIQQSINALTVQCTLQPCSFICKNAIGTTFVICHFNSYF